MATSDEVAPHNVEEPPLVGHHTTRFTKSTFSYKWSIHDFLTICQMKDQDESYDEIKSPSFMSAGCDDFKWQLNIYPHGIHPITRSLPSTPWVGLQSGLQLVSLSSTPCVQQEGKKHLSCSYDILFFGEKAPTGLFRVSIQER